MCIGQLYLYTSEEIPLVPRNLTPAEIPGEIERFSDALITTRKEILQIQNSITEKLGQEHGDIFNAHLLFLEDRVFIEEVIKRLNLEKKSIEYIFSQIGKKYIDVFSNMQDTYMKERASDIKDVVRRVIHNLIGKKREDFSHLTEKVIIVSYDLSPSDTAMFHSQNIVGFATALGTITSHSAIMARSTGLPAIVGIGEDVVNQGLAGAVGIIDGAKGVLIVNPTQETLEEYEKAKLELKKIEAILDQVKDLPAQTIDGHQVRVESNIEIPDDVASAVSNGAVGIGLYRTEFFYMNRNTLPTEFEHAEAYSRVCDSIEGTVIIRTFDLGGDKFVSHIQMPTEMNPFMGCRGIRFCLTQPAIFKTQLRGILRASVGRKMKIMFPLISTIDEVRHVKTILEEVKADLTQEGVEFQKDIPVGIMMETPSAAITADIIAKEVDFFSIGTNDLIQYSLAIDRVNREVAYLYNPFHPAIIRLISKIVQAGHDNGIPVSVCGETAGNPLFVIFLLGLGIDSLSASASLIPTIKKVIRSVTFEDTRELAQKILTLEHSSKIKNECLSFLEQRIPELVANERTTP